LNKIIFSKDERVQSLYRVLSSLVVKLSTVCCHSCIFW